MAHELSHVALRHGTHQASKANLIQLPAMLLGRLSEWSMLGQLAQLGIGLGANSVLSNFRATRKATLTSGFRMMAKAGYNPIEMARFFEKLEAQGGKGGPQFLSDHPNPGNGQKRSSRRFNICRAATTPLEIAANCEISSRASATCLRLRNPTRTGAVSNGDPSRQAECRNTGAVHFRCNIRTTGNLSAIIRARWSPSPPVPA